jgi:hypothetical protein
MDFGTLSEFNNHKYILPFSLPRKCFNLNSIYYYYYYYYLVCEATGTAATPGLLCQLRVIVKMIVEKQMECRLAGESEVLGENLPTPLLSTTKSNLTRPGFEPGAPRWEAGDLAPELWRGLP